MGLLGNGFGVAAGSMLLGAPEPTMATKVRGGTVITKSLWGVSTNWYNLLRAFSDDSSYDIPSSYSSLGRAAATAIDPCDKNLIRIADAAELGLDLLSMNVSIGNVAAGSSGFLRSSIGYPALNSNSILTRPGLYGDFVGSLERTSTSGMGLFQSLQYSFDAFKDSRNTNGVCGCQ